MSNINRLPTTIPPKKLESSLTQAQNAFQGMFAFKKFKPGEKKVPPPQNEQKNIPSKISKSKIDDKSINNNNQNIQSRPSLKRKADNRVEINSIFAGGLGAKSLRISHDTSDDKRISNVSINVHRATTSSESQLNVKSNSDEIDYKLPPCDTLPYVPECLGSLMYTIKEYQEDPQKFSEQLQLGSSQKNDCIGKEHLFDLLHPNGYLAIWLPQVMVRPGSSDLLSRVKQFSYNDPRQQIALQRLMEDQPEESCLNRLSMPSGKMGKLRVYQSGRIEFVLNGLSYHCQKQPLLSRMFLARHSSSEDADRTFNVLGAATNGLEVMLNLKSPLPVVDVSTVIEVPAGCDLDRRDSGGDLPAVTDRVVSTNQSAAGPQDLPVKAEQLAAAGKAEPVEDQDSCESREQHCAVKAESV